MITFNNLNYSYKAGVDVLHEITTQLGAGIHLLLGENGAGKTTLLHIIAGLRTARPANACLIDNEISADRTPGVMSKVFAYTDDMVFPQRTIKDMVKYHAVFYPNFNAELLEANLKAFELSDSDLLDKLSLGNRRKAQLAYILALNVDVLLLDEPANGLDITAKQALLGMLAKCVQPNQTVIISTHTIWDFKNIFDGVMVLHKGNLMLAKEIGEIMDKITFVIGNKIADNAIYAEDRFGQVYSIVPNDGTAESDIDYVMLYNALQCTKASALLTQING